MGPASDFSTRLIQSLLHFLDRARRIKMPTRVCVIDCVLWRLFDPAAVHCCCHVLRAAWTEPSSCVSTRRTEQQKNIYVSKKNCNPLVQRQIKAHSHPVRPAENEADAAVEPVNDGLSRQPEQKNLKVKLVM